VQIQISIPAMPDPEKNKRLATELRGLGFEITPSQMSMPQGTTDAMCFVSGLTAEQESEEMRKAAFILFEVCGGLKNVVMVHKGKSHLFTPDTAQPACAA